MVGDKMKKEQTQKRIMPKKGSFTCYKKAKIVDEFDNINYSVDAIVELKVPKTAKRFQVSSIAGEFPKFRVSEAKVVSIKKMELRVDKLGYVRKVLRKLSKNEKVVAMYGHEESRYWFHYEVGKTVKPKRSFSERKIQCASGIHAFMTVRDAKNY